MNRSFRAVLLSGAALVAMAGAAAAQSDPPGRIGRVAYLEGTVSYHDAQQDSWSKAALNAPLTTGDSLWTEPNGHDEIAIAGTRVRMDGDTQIDMLALDDSQTKLQLDQGRLDIKAIQLDQGQPYQVVTPRGTVTVQQAGDYYIHAGSTDDPTILGVRAGAAQIQTPNGQTVAVRAGELVEVNGDGATLKTQTVQSAPPAMPTYWAQRDQQISYAQPQYLSTDVTGYEDMQAYGAWSSDPEYGEVWTPNAVAADWQPYSNGYWAYSDPYGWNWVGAEPWGFAPYHYGRWAECNNRWFWVPPDRREHAVYAPALVAFVGGVELGAAIGGGHQPVGWFPLGPHEAYVPPYARDRTYYERVNAGAHVPPAALTDRWNHAEHHEALMANQQNEPMANRRFTRVVSAEDFAHSRPVQQAAIKVDTAKLANAPVAPVSAPPAPNHSFAAPGTAAPGHEPNRAQGQQANAPQANAAGQTRFGNMEEIARPRDPARPAAPGPKIANQTAAPNGSPNAAPNNAPHPGMTGRPNGLPPLVPHAGAPAPHVEGAQPQQNAQHPGQLPTLPQANREEPNRAQPNVAQPNAAQPNRPGEPNRPAEANRAEPHPNAEAPQHQEPARPAENHVTPPQAQPQHQAAEPPRPAPQVAQPQHAEPQRAEPPRAEPQRAEPQHAPQQPPHQAEAPRAEPQRAEPQHAAPPPQAHVEPPHQAAPAPHVEAPRPQQAQAPAPAPHPAAPPPQAAHPAPAPAPAQEHHEEKK